jgi:hypothetical protein
MQKLQMTAHAIGDIEALLEAAGIDDEEDNSASFEDEILQLVLAALAGKDVDKATRQAEASILEAGVKLAAEESNINSMLGSMEGAEYVGPRTPKLPPNVRSMDSREFTLAALKSLDAVSRRKTTGYTSSSKTERENGFALIKLSAVSAVPSFMVPAPPPSRAS